LNAGKDDGSHYSLIDGYRVTSGAAEGRVFGNDLDPRHLLQTLKGLERFRIDDFEIERPRVGIDGEFFDELPFHPGDLGKLSCLPEPFDNFPANLDLNDSTLSFEGDF